MAENKDNEEMEMMDEETTIIVLTDEKGEATPFEFLDLIQYNGEEYAVLLPANVEESDEDGEEEVIILQFVEDENDQETYIGVVDEEILEAVFHIFKEKWEDSFNFVDDEETEEE